VFRARWPGLEEGDHLGFTLNLFAGLLVHAMLAETVGVAPSLMVRNSNFVRKVVFPLPVLVAVPLGTALVHASLGLAILLGVNAVWGSGLHLSALAMPLVLAPYLLMLLGLSLAFAALGVYVRDLVQITGALVTVALFTSTVFFPREMVPTMLAGVVDFNPISWPVQAMRDAVLLGKWPDPAGYAIYMLAALVVLALGWRCFASLRRGFSDVL
jgi:lipopolysaccharide transport system permease protein